MEMLNIDEREERRELRALAKQIHSESCVLVLGPRLAVRASDPKGQTLDQILANELLVGLSIAAEEKPRSLREAAEIHFNQHGKVVGADSG